MNELFPGRRAMPTTRAMFDALCEKPSGMTSGEIIDKVYGFREDGGPDWARESIHCSVCRFNDLARVERLGLRIRSITGRRYCIFVVKEETDANVDGREIFGSESFGGRRLDGKPDRRATRRRDDP